MLLHALSVCFTLYTVYVNDVTVIKIYVLKLYFLLSYPLPGQFPSMLFILPLCAVP